MWLFLKSLAINITESYFLNSSKLLQNIKLIFDLEKHIKSLFIFMAQKLIK